MAKDEMDKLQEEFELDPEDYFANLKSKKQETTDEDLIRLYENTEILLKKAHALGQSMAIRKLLFTADVFEKEKTLYNMGFRTFLYRDDIEFYTSKVAKKAVKIIELKRYPRVIPDEVAEKVIELKEKNIFDDYFIVYTDYTGESTREIKKEEMRKDPILFGVFLKDDPNLRGRLIHDRFYYIADWEDEYCDLTLSKLITETAAKGKNVERKVADSHNVSVEEIQEYIHNLDAANNTGFRVRHVSEQKKNIFQKISTFLSKKA